ncbi:MULTISPECIES: sensor histidine kinase [Methylobacterium]|uniref:histidine kinase n=1 Tax=Methylobacterium thuringiense TaxID=1003091 RepID=A0ABQ4TM85_9HYPH|nr:MULTISPECIES: HAMP domain-containing sensor histidine kinase [Methylobacterium]TXN22464.1 HAMP domain-containing histidine kinase [Methylobacterium sp. WL9]GJE56473.1 Adaptive-response sensory-kinase SasA [Methylobacterium thuringiense]
MRLFRLGSLQRRLFFGAALFILAALVVAGLAIGLVLYRFARAQIDGRLDAEIAALVADLRRGPEGLHRAREPGAAGSERGPAGWYWQVRSGDTVLRSASLKGATLSLPAQPAPSDEDGPRPADGNGPAGEALILRILTLPSANGAPPVTIAASAPAAALHGPLREAARTLVLTLGLLGLGLLAAVTAQVRLGLRPLDRLRSNLAEVRAGSRARVPVDQPSEVRPLVDEVNLLLDRNEAGLERARAQVANLAHGLKTPLATLTMALDRTRDPDGRLSHLVTGMDRRVRHHLRRARAAALGSPTRARTDLAAHVADLADTLARLHSGKVLRIDRAVAAGTFVSCDAEDLDEMLGNLVDNACRWAKGRVRITATREAPDVSVGIEDDGPGLEPEAIAHVLQRGRRLDESVPGDGFGLPITLELAGLYGGGLDLGRSDLGGLRVVLRLPAA